MTPLQLRHQAGFSPNAMLGLSDSWYTQARPEQIKIHALTRGADVDPHKDFAVRNLERENREDKQL